MSKFWSDVRYELSRVWPRFVYFFKHGQLHPEVNPPIRVRGDKYPRPPKGYTTIITPEERVITVPRVVREDGSSVQLTSATGGTFTLTAGNGRFETLPYDATVKEIRAVVDRLFGQPATWIEVAGE